MVIDDNSLMPWGKYAGYKMADIPPDYLIWLFENHKVKGHIYMYIQENMDTLKQEVKQLKK